MNKKKIFLAGMFLTSLTFFVSAQNASENVTDVLKLTVEDAVELAIQNNISIKQSRMSLDTLAKKNKYSWNSVSPSVSLGGGLSDSLPTANTGNSLSYSVSGSINMRLTPALMTSIESAKIAYENGELSYESTIRSVEKNVRLSFYTLIYQTETMDSYKIKLEAAKRTYDANQLKYSRGQTDQLTLMSSQYNYESLIPTIAKAQNSYNVSLDSLKQVLGIPLNQEVQLVGSLEDVINVSLNNDLLNQNIDELPDIKKASLSVKSAENSLKATKYSAYGPSVSLGYSYSGRGGISPSSSMQNGNSINLQISVPLDSYFPWSSTAINIGDLQNNIENAKMNLENTKTSKVMTIRNYYNTIEEAQTQVKIYESNLELMQKTYDLTLYAYNNGAKDLNSLQSAEDSLSNARFSLQNQKFSIISAILNLEDALGLPFGSLSQSKESKSE